jgi:hypothetical protein
MRAYVLEEPALEFAGGNRHIDPRVGIADFGPADAESSTAPTSIPVGLIGPAPGVEGMREWLEHCRSHIDAKASKQGQHMLFPAFPGFRDDVAFGSTLVFDDALTRVIPSAAIKCLAAANPIHAVRDAANLYSAEAESLAETNRPKVLICVRPDELNDASVEVALTDLDESASGGPERAETEDHGPSDFHDLLKANTLRLSCPLQIVRNETWSGKTPKRAKRSLQDEATRAWNIHTALYYKAGGSPWRMPRESTHLASCFVGVSFYRTLDKAALHTAMAQVFNERGDGVVVRGGPAEISKDDRQPHLDKDGATKLLSAALDEYRRIHGHLPARIVIHKSSTYSSAEIEGFESGAAGAGIQMLDLLWVLRRPTTRLFRTGQFPPLRGTVVELDETNVLVYTRGTVEFYRAYPGMYVPRPVVMNIVRCETPMTEVAREALSLSKMNWNNTQFDGREPLTLRTSSRVGQILRYASPEDAVATRYAYYM